MADGLASGAEARRTHFLYGKAPTGYSASKDGVIMAMSVIISGAIWMVRGLLGLIAGVLVFLVLSAPEESAAVGAGLLAVSLIAASLECSVSLLRAFRALSQGFRVSNAPVVIRSALNTLLILGFVLVTAFMVDLKIELVNAPALHLSPGLKVWSGYVILSALTLWAVGRYRYFESQDWLIQRDI